MLRRALSALVLTALALVAALVPTAAFAVDAPTVAYSLPRGVEFFSPTQATVAVTYTCSTWDGQPSLEGVHIRVTQSIEVVAEGDDLLTCDGTQHQVEPTVQVSSQPFENGTASVFLTVVGGPQQQFEDVPVTGVVEPPAGPRLEIQNGIVQFEDRTAASVIVNFTCGTVDDPREDYLHVTVWQRKGSDTEAIANNDQIVRVPCDGAPHSTPVVALTVERGTFVNGYGNLNAEAWVSVEGEPQVVTQDVEIVGVPEVDDRSDVSITIDAGPEPATRGQKIVARGRIERAGRAYPHARVTLEFKPDGKTYAAVKTVTSSGAGKLVTTVRATRSGSYRWTSPETAAVKAGRSAGDHVVVRKKPKPER